MDETLLGIKFRDFLRDEKIFPEASLFSNIPIVTTSGAEYKPDTLIIDPKNYQYLALIEFAGNLTNKKSKARLIREYIYALGIKVPAFLVVPKGEDEFQILVLSDGTTWIELDNSEFPNYDKLSVRILTDEKAFEKQILEDRELEQLRKKRKTKQFTLITFLSLLIGITSMIVGTVATQKGIFFSKNTEHTIPYDSLDARIVEIENQIIKLSEIKYHSKIDTVVFIDKSKTYKGLDKRLNIIENGISNNPERTLSILQVKKEIEELKNSIKFLEKSEQSDIKHLDSRLDILYNLIIGVLVAVFGTGLGFVITSLKKEK